MRTMKIEKHLVFADEIANVHHLQVSEGLSYQSERDGIRAIGPLYIKGEYETKDGDKQPFEEVLEMDVLAPNEKLGEDSFALRIEEFEASPREGGIDVTIYLSIHGLKEAPSKDKEAQAPINVPIREAKPTYVQETPIPEVKEVQEQKKNDELVDEEPTVELEGFEDLFEDANTTYTSYRMVVAKAQDSYGSIAQRYDVKEDALREANHNKDIQPKTLVILPFVGQNEKEKHM